MHKGKNENLTSNDSDHYVENNSVNKPEGGEFHPLIHWLIIGVMVVVMTPLIFLMNLITGDNK